MKWTHSLWMTLALCLALPAQAQDEASGGVEINMDALEGLNPGREETAPAGDDIPLPPAIEQKQSESPPEVTSSPPEAMQPAPQSPVAPTPSVVSTQSASRATTRALKDLVIPVLFQPESDQIGIKAAETLDGVIDRAQGKGVRLQLMAYAGTEKSTESEARRLALQRAIKVRGYLMDHGYPGSAIDVRPQGRAEDSPKERVDIIFLPQ